MHALWRRDVALFLVLFIVLSVLLLAGCSEESQSDLAGSTTGPAVEINCARLQRQDALERTPRTGVGDTRVDVVCPGSGVVTTP